MSYAYPQKHCDYTARAATQFIMTTPPICVGLPSDSHPTEYNKCLRNGTPTSCRHTSIPSIRSRSQHQGHASAHKLSRYHPPNAGCHIGYGAHPTRNGPVATAGCTPGRTPPEVKHTWMAPRFPYRCRTPPIRVTLHPHTSRVATLSHPHKCCTMAHPFLGNHTLAHTSVFNKPHISWTTRDPWYAYVPPSEYEI